MASQVPITDSGDLDLDRHVVRGAEAVASALTCELKTLRRSYFADLAAGLDGDLLFGPLSWLGDPAAEIARVAQNVEGVNSIEVQADGLVGPRILGFTLGINRGQSTEFALPFELEDPA